MSDQRFKNTVEKSNQKRLHSEEYFGDQRDFWWHKDFLQLMAKRLKLDEIKNVLDVGSGQGHWGLTLLPLLSDDCRLTGVEPEAQWRVIAHEKAASLKFEDKTDYVAGTAEAVPYDDNSFDMVTCQTVIIHVKDPMIALAEMKRVLKPGGILLASEPNNIAPQLTIDNLSYDDSVDDVLRMIRFQLICERGKEVCGEGNNMRGDLLPYYFSQIKLNDISSYLSDMADFYVPPYQSSRQQAGVKNIIKWIKDQWHYLKQ